MENKNVTNVTGVSNATRDQQTVRHKIYGVGKVINRDVTESDVFITVQFESGKEVRFSIPESFTQGVVVAEGSLKDEVDAAIADKEAREQARLAELCAVSPTPTPATPSRRHGRTPTTPVTVKDPTEQAFEAYLANAGYREYSDSGNPSTVFSYTHAIKLVLKEEGLTWHSLQKNIKSVISTYDVGGAKQHVGAQGNCTVINALKRYDEFVNP